jgi:hypothetical protein
MHGKHVVLDQNPTLQTYFSDDGWCWDIRKPKVKELLRQIRGELIELCGDSKYFHIGCDEAYHFDFTEENMNALSGFINEISDELTAIGRRTIMWGDMLLYRHSHYNKDNRYACNAPSPEVETYFLKNLKKDIIIADWQYNSPVAPVETADVFAEAGFDCLLCHAVLAPAGVLPTAGGTVPAAGGCRGIEVFLIGWPLAFLRKVGEKGGKAFERPRHFKQSGAFLGRGERGNLPR